MVKAPKNPTVAELEMQEQLDALQEQLAERDEALEKFASRTPESSGIKNVVLAFASNPQAGCACVYVNGEQVVTWDEKPTRAPSTTYLREQAERHLNRKDEGNTVMEINLPWPMPSTIDTPSVAPAAVKVSGKANDNFDQEAKRTEKEVQGA